MNKRTALLTFAASIAAITVADAGTAKSNAVRADKAQATLVGTWRRTTTCAELVAALRTAGMQKMTLDFVAGNGFIPGVTASDQIADQTNPCAGAVPRQHSHFFTKAGAFGSLDWHGQPVDDGKYRITKPGTVVIFKEFPKVTFHYRISGKSLALTPLAIPKGCTAFRCAWAISVAYPGKTWQRVR